VIVGHATGRVEVRDINNGTVEDGQIDFAANENLFAEF
jgi:ribose 5-phosphate isomerase A